MPGINRSCPAHVWADGKPAGVNARAAEELKNTARAAQKLGVEVVNGFSGSSIWPLLYSFPPVPPEMIDAGYKLFAERFNRSSTSLAIAAYASPWKSIRPRSPSTCIAPSER